MTPRPTPSRRPTVHQLRKAEAEIATLRDFLTQERADHERALMDLRTSEDARKGLRLTDLEARCLADCTAAVEAMHAAEQAQRGNSLSARGGNTALPDAATSPVGRILMHLAARYGVPLTPPPPVVDTEPDTVLVRMPPDLARQLQQLTEVERRGEWWRRCNPT